MRLMRWVWLLFLSCFSADIPAPPAIVPGGVVNAASLMPATLPGGAVARGARIRIPGVRLGPDRLVRGSESDPPSGLAGVSVQFTQGDKSIAGGLLMVSESRIDAWVPETVPLGAVNLTISRHGLVSDPYRLNVVESDAGLFTAATAPGPLLARVRDLDGVPAGALTIFASGLEASTVDVFVGGKSVRANVDRVACCRGVEQIEVDVPGDAPQGCAVSVLARVPGGPASNVIAAAIHPAGLPCHDPVDWFRGAVEHATRAGYVVLARIQMDSGVVARAQMDYGIASFARPESGQRVFPPLPPMRTCTALTDRINLRALVRQARTPEEWTSIPEKASGSLRLDAGPGIAVAGEGGKRVLAPDPRRHESYNAILGGAPPFSRRPPVPDFLAPGRYTATAPGGADVGPFSVEVVVPRVVQWRNRGAISKIERSQGVTVEWRAAHRDSAILILAVNADRFSGDSAMCLCMAPASDGRFTLPPLMLSNLPPTSEENDISASYLVLVEMPAEPPVKIEARGLDAGFAAFVSASAKVVVYR